MDAPLATAPGPDASHEFVDHTSEVTLRLRAPSFPSLVAEATRAFAELVPRSTLGAPRKEPRQFLVGGADRVASLVEWLNELVYLCEVPRWLPVDVEVEAEGEAGVRIQARGVELTRPFVLVKAATLHDAQIRAGLHGLEGEVTLDV
jgi:SHS2 domain-containing protein